MNGFYPAFCDRVIACRRDESSLGRSRRFLTGKGPSGIQGSAFTVVKSNCLLKHVVLPQAVVILKHRQLRSSSTTENLQRRRE